ncbi:hypothetical protein H4S06_001270 [Coemansia sp. BCRC 34490]|nr:hypothetical protein H4S06_001270 [Coemansia sp. BCRC 34490]
MPKLNLEQKLSKWAEHPEDDDDDDYGLIIDDSVTTEHAGVPKFSKAGSCSQLPAATAYSPLTLLPSNMHTLRPRGGVGMNRPAAKSFASTRDLLQRYAETADDENYDDLVIPEEEEELERQLAEWKTPRPRDLDWSNPTTAQVLLDDIAMSGATAVDHTAPPSAMKAMSTYTTPTPPASYVASAVVSRPRAMTSLSPSAALGDPSTLGLGLGLGLATAPAAAADERPTRRQQKIASSRQRLLEWQQRQENQHQNKHQQSQQQTQQQPHHAQQRPSRRPMLIRNTQRATEPIVIGCVCYDPATRMWVGNEEEGSRIANAIAESERQLRSSSAARSERPIDADKLVRKISQRAGNPNLVPALPEDMVVDGPDHDAASAAFASDHSQSVFWQQHRQLPTSPVKHTGGAIGLRPRSPRSPRSPLAVCAAVDAGRPTLISPAAAAAAIAGVAGGRGGADGGDACRRARPIFDPHNLRWITPNEMEEDAEDEQNARGPHANPFWNIADLPLEPLLPPIDSIHHANRLRSASDAIAVDNNRNCFVLTDEQIEAYHRESIDYAAFARHWFPKSSST